MKGLFNTVAVVVLGCLLFFTGSFLGSIVTGKLLVNSHEQDLLQVENTLLNSLVEKGREQELGEYVLAEVSLISSGEKGGVFLTNSGVILCGYEGACIHEVGHWLDKYLGYISETIEFQEALDLYIQSCVEKNDLGSIEYYCNLARFPGLVGNPLESHTFGNETVEWGGYTEAYAEMYEYSVLYNHEMPSELSEFFEE